MAASRPENQRKFNPSIPRSPARLREKVIRKGLASADMAARLSEAELLEFLFLPGFSTKEAVTEISGRAVIDSSPGQGTSVELRWPA